MSIIHRSGKLNANADGVSRNPLPNNATNPAAELDPDENVEVGRILFPKSVNPDPCPILIPDEPTITKREDDASVFEMGGGPTTVEHQLEHLSDEQILSIGALSVQPLNETELTRLPTDCRIAHITTIGIEPELLQLCSEAIQNDQNARVIHQHCMRVKSTSLDNEEESNGVARMLAPPWKKDFLERRFYLFNDLLYRKENFHSSIVVLHSSVQTTLLDLTHDHGLAGHFGADKTFEHLCRLAWWPSMRSQVEDYCKTCQSCQIAKHRPGKQPGLLQQIDTPSKPWTVIHMDFVTGLPHAGVLDYDAVFVIVDRFSKMTRFVPSRKDDTAEDIARKYNAWVISITGLPQVIISDRDPKFTSKFWKTLHKLLGTRLAFSTAHHSQTDGQAERFIGTLEEAIRAYCQFGQPIERDGLSLDWVDLLPQLEFAYNSTINKATNQTPFEAAFGWQPSSADNLIMAAADLPEAFLNNDAKVWTEILELSRQRASAAIEHAFDESKRRWDEHHHPLDFTKYHRAYVSTKFFNFENVLEKVKPKWIGPFDIVKVHGPNAVQLRMEEPYDRRHPVFPISLLKEAADPKYKFPDRQKPKPLQRPVAINPDGSEEWEVDQILSSRRIRRAGKSVTEYEVRWKRWDPLDTSWMPESEITSKSLIREYRTKNRNKQDSARAEQGSEEENVSDSETLVLPPTKRTRTINQPAEDHVPRRSGRAQRIRRVDEDVNPF